MARSTHGPTARAWFTVVASYALLASALTWPLPRHLRTQLLGDPGGDLGTYIWNLWVFRHELLSHGHLPVSTNHLFAYTGGADFSVHNYAPIAGVLGTILAGPLGVVGAFNALTLAFAAVSGLSVFVLARRVGLSAGSAWFAGALFMACPVLVARQTAHFSLVIAAPLPLFLWALLRTLDTQRVRDAILVGALVAVAHYSDAYYGIYCVVMGAFVVVWRFARIEWPRTVPSCPRFAQFLHTAIGGATAAIIWRIVTGTHSVQLGPIHFGLQTLYTPQLILLAAILLRAWLAWRPTVRWDAAVPRPRRLLGLGLVSVASSLLLLTPTLIGIAIRFSHRRLPQAEVLWRSSPRGMDLLAPLVPNPNHPWFGNVTRSWFLPDRPDAIPEFIGSVSLAALAIVALAGWRRLLNRFWVAFTAFFFLLALGPFVHVAGVNTYVAGPWAFLRYLPVIGMARSPSRFAIVAALGLSLLVASSIDALARRRPRVSRLAIAIVAAVLAVELLPAPRPLFSAAVPDVYRRVAAEGDESGTLLDLPTGVRDGTSSIGDFRPSSEYFQVTHGRRLVGGYLSRVSEWRKRENHRSPMLRALYVLSEGRRPSPELIDEARRSREAFLKRSCVTFVIVDKSRASDDLRALAVDMLDLREVHRDAGYTLFTPVNPPGCDATRRGQAPDTTSR